MALVIVYMIIITGMNVVDNLNSVYVINKPCVCSSTMRLSTFCGLHRDTEHQMVIEARQTGLIVNNKNLE